MSNKVNVEELSARATAAMDRAWGAGHVYGPVEINTILAMLGNIFANSGSRQQQLFIICSMQSLLGALIANLDEEGKRS